jgi:hypothetical protein
MYSPGILRESMDTEIYAKPNISGALAPLLVRLGLVNLHIWVQPRHIAIVNVRCKHGSTENPHVWPLAFSGRNLSDLVRLR